MSTVVVLVVVLAGIGLVLAALLYNGSTERKPPSAGPDWRRGFDIWPFF